MLIAVLSDIAHPVLGAATDALVPDLLAVQQHVRAVELLQPAPTIDKVAVAVDLDARQTVDLTRHAHQKETF
jgi:hypothetical protein